MLTGVVKSAFRASDADEYEPAAVVQRVRGNLSAFGPERFVTLIAAVVAGDGELRYVNAGHPAGLLWRAGGAIQRLPSTGPLVSPALPPCTWEQLNVSMAPGDQLLLYTDGISDTLAGDQDGGDEQIAAAIAKHPEGGVPLLDALLSQVRARLAGRPQTDDLTLLTAKVLARGVSGIRP
jgi:sigma-B regulation protein RsbU (phosphoserine phosphatase)